MRSEVALLDEFLEKRKPVMERESSERCAPGRFAERFLEDKRLIFLEMRDLGWGRLESWGGGGGVCSN